jgi:hypothetical protein
MTSGLYAANIGPKQLGKLTNYADYLRCFGALRKRALHRHSSEHQVKLEI